MFCRELIISIILAIAAEVGVPQYFALSVAIEESDLNPVAVNVNMNGTVDRGVMQLNSAYFAHVDWQCVESNIRAGINHIMVLKNKPDINTWWSVAIAYNAGHSRLHNPPATSGSYANRVIDRFNGFMGGSAPVVIR